MAWQKQDKLKVGDIVIHTPTYERFIVKKIEGKTIYIDDCPAEMPKEKGD